MMRPTLRLASRFSVLLIVTSVTLSLGAISRMVLAPSDWSSRLVTLDPSRPYDYFALGEEVADAATTPEERELARHLFGLAGNLAPDLLGRSAALAQASLARDERQRRTLRALASLLDPSASGLPAATGERRPAVEHVVALSEAFSYVRRGQGPRATSELRVPEVSQLLDKYGHSLPGGPTRFREDCGTYRGGLRPSFSSEQMLVMLEVEEAVLSASEQQIDRNMPWSTAMLETNGAPLLEVDVAKLDLALNVDPSRPFWRNGQWVSQAK
jgi:hypothetical protein